MIVASQITEVLLLIRKSKHMVHINFPHKSVGYIALESPDFKFIGPDHKVVQLHDLDQYMAAAKVIRSTGVPNYRCVRIPISSDLNITAWEYHLREYPHKKIILYLKFGFPWVSLIQMH